MQIAFLHWGKRMLVDGWNGVCSWKMAEGGAAAVAGSQSRPDAGQIVATQILSSSSLAHPIHSPWLLLQVKVLQSVESESSLLLSLCLRQEGLGAFWWTGISPGAIRKQALALERDWQGSQKRAQGGEACVSCWVEQLKRGQLCLWVRNSSLYFIYVWWMYSCVYMLVMPTSLHKELEMAYENACNVKVQNKKLWELKWKENKGQENNETRSKTGIHKCVIIVLYVC